MEPPAAKRVRVHFGSFEEAERKRIEGKEGGGASAAVQAGIKAGNINIDGECAVFGNIRHYRSCCNGFMAPPAYALKYHSI